MSDQGSPPRLGAPLARGPMGGDQFTSIHHHVFRDSRLSAKAMGIFGFLSTHSDGERIDTKSIAEAMKDGWDVVLSGLQELERHHCLIRHQARGVAGKVGKAVWFYTDLPAQLRADGIVDESVVAEQVQAAFERWRTSRPGAGHGEVRQ